MEKVAYTDEFGAWFDNLNEAEQDEVLKAVDRLEKMGVTLPFPYSSQIKGSVNALRELRFKVNRHQLRIIYAFNPVRQSVLLIGGDKTSDKQFYEVIVPLADKLWNKYVKEKGWLAEQADDQAGDTEED